MMQIKLVAFGIAKDILQHRELSLTVKTNATVGDVKEQLKATYPKFKALAKFSLAVEESYQSDDFVILENQEVVIIPPVAGG